MNNFVKGIVTVSLVMLVTPFSARFIPDAIKSKKVFNIGISVAAETMAYPKKKPEYKLVETARYLDETTGEIKELSLKEYLEAAVAGSLSLEAEPELIKAQTVLMYTYLLGRRQSETFSPTNELRGCDISGDTGKYIRLMFEDEAKEIYKDNWDRYKKKLDACIDCCWGEYVAYIDDPIVVAYCFSCGGVTESAKNVLGCDVPYLVSVISEYDKDYITEAVFDSDVIFSKIAYDKGITLFGDPSEWLEISDVSDTGYVKEITAGDGSKLSGVELANLLGLPSARFEITYDKDHDRFNFTVTGRGHLMGLSQYGGNRMAKEGQDYKTILDHYFKGTFIRTSK